MFGYITIDRDELKGKDFDRYRAFYCGVCRDLKDTCGELSRLTLTYDMTFLAILLTGLYEGSTEQQEVRCMLHPGRKERVIRNAWTAYAADMNLLLIYHNLLDDWIDDRNAARLAEAKALEKSYRKTAEKYPRQVKAITSYLEKLHQAEKRRARSIDLAAGLTGELMAEVFCMQEDVWSADLRRIGFYIGKFIYLMDAYDDLEKDREKGSYNPFLYISSKKDYEARVLEILTMMAAEAARGFERLPIIREVDILRNIMYSGIWVRYRIKQNKKDEK